MFPRVSLTYLFSIIYILKFTTATSLTNSTSLESFPQTNTSTSTPLNASIEDFAVSPTWNGTTLPTTASSLTSIYALLDLALQNFTSTISTNTWQTSSFPNLAISITPPPNQNQTTIRWAIWGIASAIKTMLATHRYETASFALTYRTTPVGYANYTTPETVAAPITKPQIEAASGPFGTTETEISISPSSRNAPIVYTLDGPSSNNNNTLNTTTLQLAVSFTTVTIDQESYFAAIVNALVALAPHPADERVRQWSFSSPGVTDGVEIAFHAVAREGVPGLEFGYVSRAMGWLPRIMAQEGVWREADVGVVVGGVVVGYGSVRRGGGSGEMGGWGVANVLVAG